MKNKNMISFIIFAIPLFMACSDYLKESSGDLLIPGKVEEYMPLLYGEGYPYRFNREAGWFKLMTDDVEMGCLEKDASSDPELVFDVLNGGDGKYAYTWDYMMEEKIRDTFWEARYTNILGCNTIIHALPIMEYKEDEIGKYYYLAAQAHALRAYHYFCLINTYALPYTAENKLRLGVVIKTSPEIDIAPKSRSSVQEVYDLINQDIAKAIEYIEKSTPSVNIHLLNSASIRLLASRIALFQQKWSDVIENGNLFLNENNFIFDLNTVAEEKMGTESGADFFIMNAGENKEIVFTFGDSYTYDFLSPSYTQFGLGFRVSYKDEGALIKLYEDSDLRLKSYFMQDYTKKGMFGLPDETIYCYHYPIKFKSVANAKGYRENWRTVEVFLNMAEAYVQQDNDISTKAIDILNKLRSKRIRWSEFKNLTASDFKTKDELLQFIWDERRRELCFEEVMRFWDLRRNGMPEIKHKLYSDKVNYESYVLKQNGNNYVLQIPKSEELHNDAIEPNKRDVITPE